MKLSPAAPLLLLVLLAPAGWSCGGSSSSTSGADSGVHADAGGDVLTNPEAGGTCRSAPPTIHRASAGTCPSHETDEGADAGLPGCTPPHDACLADSDCGATGVCDCEAPRCTEPFAVAGNVCLPSNCRVDSDCACGFCAGDTSCGGLDGYYCTTPQDECSTDADCQDGASSMQCRWSAARWACVVAVGCPG
ncbi:MAG TPA: hypothetical protein VGG39_29120 [Polyangiaceae bacterium]|jgi:hypothetical protein